MSSLVTSNSHIEYLLTGRFTSTNSFVCRLDQRGSEEERQGQEESELEYNVFSSAISPLESRRITKNQAKKSAILKHCLVFC